MQNGGDILPAHARDGDAVRFIGADTGKTVAQAETEARRAV